MVGPIKLDDTCKTQPIDYIKPQPKTDYGVKVILDRSQAPKTIVETPMIKLHITKPITTKPNTTKAGWWTQFILGLTTFLMFCLYLRGL